MFADGSSESLFYITSYRLNIFQQNPINKFKGMLADCSFEKAKNTKWTFKKIPLKISKDCSFESGYYIIPYQTRYYKKSHWTFQRNALLKVGKLSRGKMQNARLQSFKDKSNEICGGAVSDLYSTNLLKTLKSQIHIQQISWKL